MANYAASVLAEAKLILKDRFASPEKRLKSPGVFAAFRKNTDIAVPNVGDLRTSVNRAEKAYFANRTKRANFGGRAHNHTGAVGDSTEVALTWAQYGDVFQTGLKRSENNLMNDAMLLANELENAFKNIHEAIDTAALTYLGTNKSTVNVATKNGVFDAVNDVFEIDSDTVERALQFAKSMMRQNYHKGMFEAILDPVFFAQAEHYLNQGAGNSQNLVYQGNGVSIWEAIGLNDANYPLGSGYMIPEGTIAAIDWIPQKNRDGWGDYESFNGGYGTIQDPITGITMAVHGYSTRADNSATGGDAQDVNTEWEISVDISMNHAPLTTANETVIHEIGLIADPA